MPPPSSGVKLAGSARRAPPPTIFGTLTVTPSGIPMKVTTNSLAFSFMSPIELAKPASWIVMVAVPPSAVPCFTLENVCSIYLDFQTGCHGREFERNRREPPSLQHSPPR